MEKLISEPIRKPVLQLDLLTLPSLGPPGSSSNSLGQMLTLSRRSEQPAHPLCEREAQPRGWTDGDLSISLLILCNNLAQHWARAGQCPRSWAVLQYHQNLFHSTFPAPKPWGSAKAPPSCHCQQTRIISKRWWATALFRDLKGNSKTSSSTTHFRDTWTSCMPPPPLWPRTCDTSENPL